MSTFVLAKLPTTMQVAESLLEIGAVKLNVNNPFEWASGIKSPIYCDNRIINSKVSVRDYIVGELTNLVSSKFPDVEIIAGVATGGIPLGSLIAYRLKLPFIYVRGEAKKHGLMRQVEGYFEDGNKVLLFEDHVSTGGSSKIAIEALRKVGLNVVCLLSVMTYEFEVAKELYKSLNIRHESLCNLDAILKTATANKIISEKEKEDILEFRKNPKTWAGNR